MDSFSDIWRLVQDYCKSKITEVAYSVWIEPLKPVGFDGTTVSLHVDAAFTKKIVLDKFSSLLHDAFEQILGFPVELDIEVPSQEAAPAVQTAAVQQPTAEYEYTFDTFVVGSSNKFAHAAAQAVAANPGGTYNPLFIYGNSGLGKTHLLNAICYEIRKNNPNASIIYTRGEDFTNELISYISEKNTVEFHNKYRRADILLVDDIQFIAGKVSTQEEFFHTFNSLNQDGKQIVLTSDRPPKEIQTLEDRLRTRFEWGLLADIQPPDLETRMAIIKRKAQVLDISIPDDVVQFIAERIKANIRQLEGVVKKLKAYQSIEGHTPSLLIAQNAVRDILNDHQPTPVTVERIISEVARTFGISPEDIRSKKRDSSTSKARQIAMYVIREITDLSTEAIGMEFSKRDHSTVIYALNHIEADMKKNADLRATVADTIKNIQEQ